MYKMHIEADTIKKGLTKVKQVIASGIKKGVDTTATQMRKDAIEILNAKIEAKHAQKPWLKSTGKLASSITVNKTGTFKLEGSDYKAFIFTTGVHYAPYVEFKGIKKNFEGYYFMMGAYEKGRQTIQENVTQAVIRELQTKFKRG